MTMDILVYKDGRFVCTENPLKADSLEGLAMLVTNPQDGDVLKYDAASGTWLNGTGSDFAPTITSPQNGQVIKYNGTAWVNGTGGGDFAPDISNPQDGQVLVYDGTAGKWVNGAASGGGGSFVVHIDGNDTLDKTWNEINTALTAGKYCVIIVNPANQVNIEIIISVGYGSDFWSVYSTDDQYSYEYIIDSASGYPIKREIIPHVES